MALSSLQGASFDMLSHLLEGRPTKESPQVFCEGLRESGSQVQREPRTGLVTPPCEAQSVLTAAVPPRGGSAEENSAPAGTY